MMINLRRCALCTSDNYLEAGALPLHQELMHQAHPAGGTPPVRVEPRIEPMPQRPKMILCAHADLDGRGAHWRAPDETCWVALAADAERA